MDKVRIIKRYQNRKLYDTHQSCYVTLEEIAQIVREGCEIQVIDNKTKDDITYMTQIQLLFDRERKTAKSDDVELLKRVVRSPEGTFTSYVKSLEASLKERASKDETTEEGFGTTPFIPKKELDTIGETAANTLN